MLFTLEKFNVNVDEFMLGVADEETVNQGFEEFCQIKRNFFNKQLSAEEVFVIQPTPTDTKRKASYCLCKVYV